MPISKTDAANATAVAVRTGRTQIQNIEVMQMVAAASRLFLQLFNTNSPTVGTTAPEMVIPIPAGDANKDFTVYKMQFKGKTGGIDFSTGFAYAVTTTHDGNTNPTGGQEPQVKIEWEAVGA